MPADSAPAPWVAAIVIYCGSCYMPDAVWGLGHERNQSRVPAFRECTTSSRTDVGNLQILQRTPLPLAQCV